MRFSPSDFRGWKKFPKWPAGEKVGPKKKIIGSKWNTCSALSEVLCVLGAILFLAQVYLPETCLIFFGHLATNCCVTLFFSHPKNKHQIFRDMSPWFKPRNVTTQHQRKNRRCHIQDLRQVSETLHEKICRNEEHHLQDASKWEWRWSGTAPQGVVFFGGFWRKNIRGFCLQKQG